MFEQQAADKPENVRGKIAEGKLRKWMEEVVLLNQAHVNADKYEGKTIEQLRAELSGTTGENVVIRRFARFAVGRLNDAKPAFKRVLLKLSGEALMGDLEFGTDAATVDAIARSSRACTTAASRSRSCWAPATSTAASRARRPAWTARRRTTWACSRSSSTR